jgi:hypothetical protein
MPIFEFSPLEDPRWAYFIDRHHGASVFHTYAWLRLLSNTYGYEPIVFTTSAPGQELKDAAVFCKVRSWLTGRRLVSLPFSDHCEPLLMPGHGSELLGGVVQYSRVKGWDYVELRPLKFDAVNYPFLRPSSLLVRHVIDLTPPLQTLLANLHRACVARKLRRAERERLTVQIGRSSELFGKFYSLFIELRRRKHLPPQPQSWFRQLALNFGDRCTIMIASQGDRPVAGILLLRHADTLIYKYGCSTKADQALGGMQLLFWRAIQFGKENGCATFDLGRSDVQDQGLVTFKDRLGAKREPLTYLRFPSTNCTSDRLASSKWAQEFVRIAPDRILAATGSFLYRHFG